MIDAVLSYHMNGATCGVAKFNARLARELGVPLKPIKYSEMHQYKHPLVSIKPSEIDANTYAWFPFPMLQSFDLFLHDWDVHSACLVRLADVTYAANTVVASQARTESDRVIEAWCPSTIEGNHTRGTINVLTFGMAHKIQTAHYEKLKALLDATGEDYTVSVSTAIHEGSPWDETARVGERLRGIFGGHLRVLGYLADDGLAAELQRATAVALFFDPAVRANNTTFWAAMDSGKPVISNRDAYSPAIGGWYDIGELIKWPDQTYCDAHQTNGEFFTERYGWSRLTAMMQEQPCAK